MNPFKKEVQICVFQEHGIKDIMMFKGDETVKSDIFQGLEIPLGEIFTV